MEGAQLPLDHRSGEPLETLVQCLHHSLGPGSVRILISDAPEVPPCACAPGAWAGSLAGGAGGFPEEPVPVPGCPSLAQGFWKTVAQAGSPPQTGAETLCVAARLNGQGAAAVQVEVSHFARQDVRFRRFFAWSLRMGLLWTISTLADQSAVTASLRREEAARGDMISSAQGQFEELEQISFQLHDGAVQKVVAALHTVGALRVGVPDEEEQHALLLRSEELLSQAVLELRSVINSLHTPSATEQRG